MSLSTRDQVAHLLRRFAFGATEDDLRRLTPLGYEKVLEYLVLDKKRPEPPAHPYEFFWQRNADAEVSTERVRAWWVFRMLTTRRPVQEKLALFWHSHFAVSDSKIEDATMMLEYLLVLQRHGQGTFREILGAVAKSPAMLRYLDLSQSFRGRPNENWPRELMELFTIGIGNYSETDVKEMARAFTGWGYLATYGSSADSANAKLLDSLQHHRPFNTFVFMPDMVDPGEKMILGRRGPINGEQVLDMLAAHPLTAKRICTKLWEFFAYPDPEPGLVERLAHRYQETGGDIRQILLAIARSPEFMSDRCIRRQVKSPADYCVSISRQMDIGKLLEGLRPKDATPQTMIRFRCFNQSRILAAAMEAQGLSLLYPVDVSGWKGNDAWISTATMMARLRFRGLLIGYDEDLLPGGEAILKALQTKKPKTGVAAAKALAALFDLPLSARSLNLVGQVWSAEAIRSIPSGNPVDPILRSMALLVAAPESQLN